MAPREVPFEPSDSTGPSRYTFWVMIFMFFLSGAAALMYQIIWAKQLALIFGVTLYATSAVVTTFMAGLALGSLYFGRMVDRWKRPLVLFAILEACIGAFALVFPAILVALTRIYVVFYGSFGDNHYVMSLLRFAMAFLVLIVPTSLMGGTLPVITRAYVLGRKKLGRDIASLYSANNIGAFVGCVSAGYIFLELFGPTGALRLAGLINMVVMAMSLYISRQWKAGPAEVQSQSNQLASGAQSGGLSRPVKVALWVFALEGVASLVYQMAWMRELIFFVNSDIFGVTAIVATFLMSLSVGAFACRRWVDRLKNLYKTLGIIELGIAITALATIPIMPYLLGAKNAVLANTLSIGFPLSVGITAGNFAVTLIVILLPVALMGATLPVVSGIYVDQLRGLGRKMGVIGCLDTVGSIFGAFAGGFILIPLLGIGKTIIATAMLNLVLAGWIFAADPVSRRKLGRRVGFIISIAGVPVTAALLVLKPIPLINYSSYMMSSEIFKYKLVEYQEDHISSVSVLEQENFARFLVKFHGIKTSSSTTVDRMKPANVNHVVFFSCT